MLAARRTGDPRCPSQTAHPVLGMHRFPLAVALEALFVVGAAAVATFYNAGLHSGADPYTLYDEQTGLYHAYSTSGQDPGWLFAIYTSPDLSTWTRRPGGAMRACTHNGTALQTGQVCWAKDWQVRTRGGGLQVRRGLTAWLAVGSRSVPQCSHWVVLSLLWRSAA